MVGNAHPKFPNFTSLRPATLCDKLGILYRRFDRLLSPPSTWADDIASCRATAV